jgi:iron-sulfur cluster assembly protein
MQKIHFTPAASAEIRRFLASGAVPENYSLRVGIEDGLPGCSGGVNAYVLGFDEKRETDDEDLIEGFRVLIDKRHALHVLGMEIDFTTLGEESGFVFNNPRKKHEK